MDTRLYGTLNAEAHLTVTIDSGIALFDVAKNATMKSIKEAIRSLRDAATRPNVFASVACYENCEIGAGLIDLLDIYQAIRETGFPTRIPTALVVVPSQLDAARCYSQLQAARGIIGAAFTDRRSAIDWALEMAALINCDAQASPASTG